ncbi:MAG: SEC-C domain-containing protein [Blastomonas fulva]|uniref:SEC-C metal-binding domain-containing protein n=1 Tax=Blastomonas fulva TaxID=1550728 RepID=UPI0024E1A3D6|nr:SEC-C metal-binding domain-containing protein [Blastomonas fulva]MDK2755584.1 SEC-C domain-containing protein [Blastomonas fulva]
MAVTPSAAAVIGPFDHSPMDRAQLARIESVHRGFFYQHVYAVALLLALGRHVGAVLAVELDEDIELVVGGVHWYIQVKTRLTPVQPSDVKSALERFDALRVKHISGVRSGRAKFALVSNSEPSQGLQQQLDGVAWPDDVQMITPARGAGDDLPIAGSDVDAMMDISTAIAETVPFGGLAPRTLVFKLATLVQQASAGGRDHQFAAYDLPELLEQLVIQLQDFPEPPSPYRPQRDEPPIASDKRIRLIVGFSGAGKTAWAAEAARHASDALIYFDVGDLPSRAVPTNLAREIIARFLGGRAKGVGGVQLPPNGGIDALRYADSLLADERIRAIIVLDNVHRLSVADLREIVSGAPNQAFIALGQPWAERALVEATLGIEAEALGGFGPDAVAAVFAAEGVGVDPETVETVLHLTAGLPLFVINAARLSAQQFGGAARAFCESILARTHQQDTAQDLILEVAFSSLSKEARDAAAILGACDIALDANETSAMLGPLGEQAVVSQALRELRRASMLVNFAEARSGLHDALRPLAAGHLAQMSQVTVGEALERLQLLLVASLHTRQDIPRLTFLIRLLPRVGRTDALVDLATSEMFYEQGNMAMMWDTLVEAAEDPSYSPRDQFWALDALSYWESRDGGIPDEGRVGQMAELVANNPFEARERLNLTFKQMIIAGSAGDRKLVEAHYREGRKAAKTEEAGRILRYNRAVSLYRAGALQQTRNALEPLIEEMHQALGLRENDLLFKNGPALTELLGGSDPDDVKRLADALNLWSTVVVRLNLPPMMRRIQASKLYATVGAGRSAAVAAQELADEMLKIMAMPEGAREVFDQHIFPLIDHYKLTDLALEARAEYAVALAYCGDFDGADQQMRALGNYAGDEEWEAKHDHALDLIQRIRSGVARIGAPMRASSSSLRNPNSVGRHTRPDDPCPCGSGRKFKRCHSRR